jgi:hypothetical protein
MNTEARIERARKKKKRRPPTEFIGGSASPRKVSGVR